jgi:phosphoglucosamine mutase
VIDRLFGTDGIRGPAGVPPLDDSTVAAVGRALARVLARRLDRPARVVTGMDTRESGPHLEALLTAGLLGEGASVESCGVIPTPGVACIASRGGFDAGVVISASHNPFTDNGIKIFARTGRKLDDDAEREIEAAIPGLRDVAPAPAPARRSAHGVDYYLDFLRESTAPLELNGLRLALDCAHGAASYMAPPLFESLGATVAAVGVTPNGRNINQDCGSLHLDTVAALVKEFGADLGIAFDGDADRVLFVDSTGAPVDGDQIMYILATDLCLRGELKGNVVVATVMSNIGLERALGKHGIGLLRTAVGDRYVLDELIRSDASIGGEQSGHVILPRLSLAGDGMLTALEVLAVMRRTDQSLAALAAPLVRYPQVLVNVRVRERLPFEEMPQVAAAAAEVESELAGNGRLLLRYSGTENLARVMIEGPDAALIEAQAHRIAMAIRSALG